MDIKNGSVLSSLMDASKSTSLPLFLNVTNKIIGAINPKAKATVITINLPDIVGSNFIASNVKIIIENDGGTKRVEIILAIF